MLPQHYKCPACRKAEEEFRAKNQSSHNTDKLRPLVFGCTCGLLAGTIALSAMTPDPLVTLYAVPYEHIEASTSGTQAIGNPTRATANMTSSPNVSAAAPSGFWLSTKRS